MEALAEQVDGEVFVVEKDLSDPTTAADWIGEAEGRHGPIDVLVNNAGVQLIESTATCEVEAGEKLLRLNVFTPMRLTRAVLPSMLERRAGTIVDIASMAAIAPTPGMFYYNASKAALAAASEALRGELKSTGVHVVTVYPGIIMTDMGEKGLQKYETTWLERLQPRGDASVLAEQIKGAVLNRGNRVIYPGFNSVARHFPALTRWAMDRFTPPLKA